jgi:hypothetical protein
MSRAGADDDATREGDAAVARHEVRLQVQGDVAVIERVYEHERSGCMRRRRRPVPGAAYKLQEQREVILVGLLLTMVAESIVLHTW